MNDPTQWRFTQFRLRTGVGGDYGTTVTCQCLGPVVDFLLPLVQIADFKPLKKVWEKAETGRRRGWSVSDTLFHATCGSILEIPRS
jgi:hypothetical protein